jgi:hypothetical protein
MNFKKTLVLGLLLLIAVLVTVRGVIPYEDQKQREQLLFKGLTAQQFSKITISRGGTAYSLVNSAPHSENPSTSGKSDSSTVDRDLSKEQARLWSVEGIEKSDLDTGALNSLISSLTQLRLTESVPAAERATDLAEYGLDKPELTVAASAVSPDGSATSGAAVSNVLLFGSKHEYLPGKRFLMVQGAPDVYLVAESVFAPADKSVADFRNKAPIDFDEAQVASVIFSKGTERRVFARSDAGRWSITEPAPMSADEGAISTLLRDLRALRVAEFVDDGATRLKELGLESPALQITVNFVDVKRAPLVIEISKGDSQVPPAAALRVSDYPGAFKVSGSDPSESLFQPIMNYRQKRLFDFEASKVQKLVFEGTGEPTITVIKENGTWRVNGKEGDSAFVREAIKRLREVEATGFPAIGKEVSFDVPRFKATVQFESGEGSPPGGSVPAKVLVAGGPGEKGADGKPTVVLRVEGSNEPFYVAQDLFNRLMPREEQLTVVPTPTPLASALPSSPTPLVP